MAGTSCQMLEVLSFFDREKAITSFKNMTLLTILVNKSTVKLSGVLSRNLAVNGKPVFLSHAQTWRAVRLIVDTGLHSRGLNR